MRDDENGALQTIGVIVKIMVKHLAEITRL